MEISGAVNNNNGIVVANPIDSGYGIYPFQSAGSSFSSDGLDGHYVRASTGYSPDYPALHDPVIGGGNSAANASSIITNLIRGDWPSWGRPRIAPDPTAGDAVPDADQLSNGIKQAHASVGGPVDPITGGYTYTANDISMPSLGWPVDFRHIYSKHRVSLPITDNCVDDNVTNPMSPGWTHNFSAHLFLSCNFQGIANGIVFQDSNGSAHKFIDKSGTGNYQAEDGLYADLIRSGSLSAYQYTIYMNDQTRYTFDNGGVLIKIDHLSTLSGGWDPLYLSYYNQSSCPNNNSAYLSSQLARIYDTSDFSHYVLELCYTAQLGTDNVWRTYLTEVHDQRGGSLTNMPYVQFNYDYLTTLLTSVRDLNGKVWNYKYADPDPSTNGVTGLLSKVIDPNGQSVEDQTYQPVPKCVVAKEVLASDCVGVLKQYHGSDSDGSRALMAGLTFNGDGSTSVTVGNNTKPIVYSSGVPTDNTTPVDPLVGIRGSSPVGYAHNPINYQLTQATQGVGVGNLIMKAVPTASGRHIQSVTHYTGDTQVPSYQETYIYLQVKYPDFPTLSFERLDSATDAAGTTVYTYDATFPTLVKTITRTKNSQLAGIASTAYSFAYTADGHLKTITDPNSVTYYTYYLDNVPGHWAGQIATKTLNYTGVASDNSTNLPAYSAPDKNITTSYK